MPNRLQLEMRSSDLESLIPDDQRVRSVWAYVEGLNLDVLYARIKAVEGGAGRSPIAPEILLSLWLDATIDAVGTARGRSSAVIRPVQADGNRLPASAQHRSASKRSNERYVACQSWRLPRRARMNAAKK